MIAGPRPLIDARDRDEPTSTMNHGVSTSKTRSGSSLYSTRKLPIGSVIPNMNDVGSCT